MNIRYALSLALLSSLSLIAAPNYLPRKRPTKTTKKVQGSVKELKTMDDYNKALKGKRPLVIKHYAPWCSACTMMAPAFEAVAKSNANKADFYAANIDEAELKPIVQKRNITGIPMTLLKNGDQETVERGSISKEELQKKVDALVKAQVAAPTKATQTKKQKRKAQQV